jgi:GT2 family glycosyltransferase
VSIVIVAWRSRAVLLDCLDSLDAHQPTQPWEVIVVDNASGDGTVEALAALPRVRVIANDTNRGLSAANNQGIRAARGRLIVISNPDVLYTAGALDRLLDVFERHPRAAISVPRLRQANGALQATAGDLPTLREALLGRARGMLHQKTSFWWTDWAHDTECRIGHGSEACYGVRQEAIAEFGPQDERFPLDWEGIEWSARATAAGWEVWFTPDSEIIHIGGVSLRQAPARSIMGSHIGMYRYFSERVPRAARGPLALCVGTRALLKMGLAGARMPLYAQAQRATRISRAAGDA